MNKITFMSDEILPSLAMVSSVVNPKNSLPILNDVRIETKDDGNGGTILVFMASDSETWLQMKATCEDVKYFTDNHAGHMVQIKTPDLGGVNNTIEAVLYCKEHGMGAYQGGTCNETDRSAQVCTQCAMATQPAQILAKPGMGVDEGYMIVYNEMQRVLALRAAKKACGCK